MMRVTQVLFSGLGGHGSVVFPMIKADKQRKWRNSLLFYGIEPLRKEYASLCNEQDLDYGYVTKKRGLDLTSYRNVYRLLKKQKPDAILLHSPNLIIVAAWYKWRHGAKIVMVEHNANHIKRKSEWAWSRLGMRLADKVVYLSQQYADSVKEKIGSAFRKRKAVVIPNGIDTGLFRPGQADSEKTVSTLSMIGRFAHPKEQLLVAKAFGNIKKRMPALPLQLMLPGEGAGQAAVVDWVREHSVADVVFPGMLNEAQILELLQDTTIYVHATKGETMSTSIMQAMACGVPVIGSNVDGINNLIDGSNGWLFDNNDQEGLENKIIMLLTDQSIRAGLGRSALMYAANKFSSATMFSSYNNVLQSLFN